MVSPLWQMSTGIVAAVLLCCLQQGCSQDDGIREYTVEKIPSTAKPQLQSASLQSAWFFKLTGPADDVLEQVVAFSRIVKSLQFDRDGTPHYDVPEGWSVTSGPAPRYQTLKINGTEPPLEVTVSALPGPESDFGGYLLSNLNRWREQLGKEPYDSSDWLEQSRSNGELVVIPTDSQIVAMVNLTGELPEEKGPGRILGAVVLLPPADNSAETTQSPSVTPGPSVTPRSAITPEVKPGLDYQKPENWSPTTGNTMRLASFEAKHEGGTADVSVSRLSGGGETLANVNRWREQVKLDELSEEDLNADSAKLKIGGQEAIYVKAVGPEQTILAAIVPDGKNKWFFKMQGPKDVVAQETENFEAFLKSVKFEDQ